MKLNFCTALLIATSILAPLSAVAEKAQNPAEAKRAALATFGKLPLSFEPTESTARFVAHSGNYTVSIGSRESSVAVTADGKSQALRFAFENANPAATLETLDQQVGVTNYYLGQDPGKWRLKVKHYAKLREQGVYPGVDVVYYGDSRRLEFDFVVAPKADPGVIALSFSGMEKFYKDATGNLVAELSGKSVRFGKPYAYQKVAGVSRPVEADYELTAAGSVHLHLGDYDKSSELIIDPVISYVTYLGGAEGDTGNGIAVDTTGPEPGVFVTGQTCSNNFPANPNPSGYTLLGNCDAYVTKYSLDGTAYLYTTILGGTTPSGASVWGNGIAVDLSDQAYIAGTSNISNLPGSAGLTDPHRYQGGDTDAFITILKADGTLLRMSYLGGKYADSANAIALDQATPPNVIVVGQTQSPDFPGYSAFKWEAQIEAYVAFVTKLDNNLDIASPKLAPGSPGYIDPEVSIFAPAPPAVGTAKFFFSEFFGGQIMTVGPAATASWQAYTSYPQYAIVYDNLQPAHSQIATNAGCTGPYVPPPVTQGNIPLPAWNATLYGLTTDGDGSCGTPVVWEDLGPDVMPVYHTTTAYGVAVDPQGDVFVAGGTDTPTLEPFSHYAGSGAWVLKVKGDDGSYIYGTALETNASQGTTADMARAIAVDSQGRAYVTGTVTGTLMTSSGAYQPKVNGSATDAFLLRMTTAGDKIDYATYLGGSGNDQGLGVAVDAGGDAYVTGSTQSKDFPTVNPMVNPSTNNLMTTLSGTSGTMDAFIAKFSADGSTLTFSSYLGGSDIDQANAIAVDQVKGDMYLAGYTASTDLELLNPQGYTAPQAQYGGATDAFVTKIAASGANIAGLATISFSPASLAFGNQTLSTSANLPVTLTNSSATATLTISQILPSGSSDFTVNYSACPISLAPGKSCTIVVTFVPTSATNESASFSVSGSASNSPQTMAITGTGIKAGSGTGTGSGSGSNGSSDFNVVASATGVSVTQGDTAVYGFTVTPINSYKGSVAFTCSGPTGSSCSVTPNPLTMDGTTVQTVTLSVNTTGGNGSMSALRPQGRSIFLALLPFSIMGMLLINKRRGVWLGLGLVALCLLLGAMSCGSGPSSASSGKLAPGTYQYTLTAKSSTNSTQTLNLSLMVSPQ